MSLISSDDMERYRHTARRRKALAAERRRFRAERGWDVARKAALVLKNDFGATDVMVFGSLLRPDYFDDRSDVDIAVKGIPDHRYLRAVAVVTGLDNEIAIDLIRIEDASQSLVRQAELGVTL